MVRVLFVWHWTSDIFLDVVSPPGDTKSNYYIQQFIDPCYYLSCVAQETRDDKDLRLFRYLRPHQEADAEVNQYLSLNRSSYWHHQEQLSFKLSASG